MEILNPNFTCDINSVTWLNFINKVIVSKERNRMRGLSSWHIFRRLLQFDLAKTPIKFQLQKIKAFPQSIQQAFVLTQSSASF